MLPRSGVIYVYQKLPVVPKSRSHESRITRLGLLLIALSLGGIVGPLYPAIRLEASYAWRQIDKSTNNVISLPKSVPVIFNPLVTEDGGSIDPINTEFSLIVPKIGINAAVIKNVDPANPGEYLEALKTGVAHAKTSHLPSDDGTVYLFSHSTNYDWFVRDLNAVFYLLKNLDTGDLIVVFYEGKRYTYRLTEKRVVPPTAISYLSPEHIGKRLILQTCWPPGSVTERLLIFADLVEERGSIL